MVKHESIDAGGVSIVMYHPGNYALLGSGAVLEEFSDAVRLSRVPSEKRYRVQQLFKARGDKHWVVLSDSKHLTHRGAVRKVNRMIKSLETLPQYMKKGGK